MINLFSYSLFKTKQIRNHRSWDNYKKDLNRYWYNIPAILIYNSILYPNAKTKFFIDTHSLNHDLFSILDSSLSLIEHVKDEFNHTEPSIWRMKPLWENVDCFFPRDIDSVPTRMEYVYTKHFMDCDTYSLMTLRSHENHYHENGCDILAGLCGFRKKNLDAYPVTYVEYFNLRNDNIWSLDQNLLIETFLKNSNILNLKDKFLDGPIDKQTRKSFFPSSSIKQNKINEIINNLTEQQKYILDLSNSICSWSGEPVDARKNYLLKMFEVDSDFVKEIKNKIEKNNKLKEFYL